MSSSKDINQQITRPLKRAGWEVTIGGGGHAIASLGEHRITYSTTPSDYRTLLNVKRWIKHCREGRCEHGDPVIPASTLESKPTRKRNRTMTTENRIASVKWAGGGRAAVRIITARAGKQTPFDIVVTPSMERVWEGHLLTEGDGEPLPVLLDFDKGEATIGKLAVNGLPLDGLWEMRPSGDADCLSIAEAAKLTGRTQQGIRSVVARGVVKAGPPGKKGALTVMRESVLAWAEKAPAGPRKGKAAPKKARTAPSEKLSAPIPATPSVRKGITLDGGGESGESLTAPHLTAAYAYETGRLEGMIAMLPERERQEISLQLQRVKRALARGEEA